MGGFNHALKGDVSTLSSRLPPSFSSSLPCMCCAHSCFVPRFSSTSMCVSTKGQYMTTVVPGRTPLTD